MLNSITQAPKAQSSNAWRPLKIRRSWTPEFALKFLVLPPTLFLIPTFVLPLAMVIYQGFGGSEPTFEYFTTIFTTSAYLHVLGQTFEAAFLSTLLALLIGLPVAHVISTSPTWFSNIALACVMIPLWTSVVTRTYAWIAVLGRKGLVNTTLIENGLIERPLQLMYNPLAVQIGMVQILLPLMVLPLLNTLRQLDKTKLMAAAILGANPLRVFAFIFIPMCAPGIIAGSVLVFITALGFYVTPALLGGETDTMIAVLIEQQVTKTLNWPLASALATLLLVTVILSLWLISLFTKRYSAGQERA